MLKEHLLPMALQAQPDTTPAWIPSSPGAIAFQLKAQPPVCNSAHHLLPQQAANTQAHLAGQFLKIPYQELWDSHPPKTQALLPILSRLQKNKNSIMYLLFAFFK